MKAALVLFTASLTFSAPVHADSSVGVCKVLTVSRDLTWEWDDYLDSGLPEFGGVTIAQCADKAHDVAEDYAGSYNKKYLRSLTLTYQWIGARETAAGTIKLDTWNQKCNGDCFERHDKDEKAN